MKPSYFELQLQLSTELETALLACSTTMEVRQVRQRFIDRSSKSNFQRIIVRCDRRIDEILAQEV